MEKNITIIEAHSNKRADIPILPGTTARDIKEHLSLDEQYVIGLGRGQEPFGDDENVYENIPDGAKLLAYAAVEVGTGGNLFTLAANEGDDEDAEVGRFAWLEHLTKRNRPKISRTPPIQSVGPISLGTANPSINTPQPIELPLPSSRSALGIRPRSEQRFPRPEFTPTTTGVLPLSPQLIEGASSRPVWNSPPPRPQRSILSGLFGTSSRPVSRDNREYWQQRGWKKDDCEYTGFYRTQFGSWRGKAEECSGGDIELYIEKPPKQLKSHPHWECFFARKKGWHWIHHNGLTDVSSGILAVEQILAESFTKNA